MILWVPTIVWILILTIGWTLYMAAPLGEKDSRIGEFMLEFTLNNRFLTLSVIAVQIVLFINFK